MTVKVNIKQIGSKRDKLAGVDLVLRNTPGTVRELIVETVHTCVSEYNERVKKGENVNLLTEEQISDLSSIGKIAFGINYGGKIADEARAAENAIQSYEDGLFRIFIGEAETGSLDEKIMLNENDCLTFIRLTMLTGRLW